MKFGKTLDYSMMLTAPLRESLQAHNSANDEKTDMIKSNHGLFTLVPEEK